MIMFPFGGGLNGDGFGDEDGYGDYEPDIRPAYKPQPKTCNRCGHRGLHWTQTKHGWRLANSGGQIHACNRDIPL